MSHGLINQNSIEFDELDEDQLSEDYIVDRFAESVVSASDWTTETILSQLERQNIWLTPGFQRRDAWTIIRKSKLIESFFLGLPIPQIVLAEKKQERGKFIVLDGKQRLLTLLQFVGKSDGKNNLFSLKNLDLLSNLEGVNFEELKSNPDFLNYLDIFYNHTVRAVVIKNWPDMEFLHLVFLRLNTGSVQLSPQELRQAMFPGDFSNYIDEVSCSSKALKMLLRIDDPDFRMRDIELMVRFLSFNLMINDYKGNMKLFLDETFKLFNEKWKEFKDIVKFKIINFEESVTAAISIFGEEDVCRRPKTFGTRRPFNRAIFDIIMFYFSEEDIRIQAMKNADIVKKGFQELWKKDHEFVNSIESTTKSIPATYKRLSTWGEKLKEILNVNFPIPKLIENRINF